MLRVTREILNAPDGGTYDTWEGVIPSTGYWVGGESSTLTFRSSLHIDSATLDAFVQNAPSRYVGWWTDSETGKVWVDTVSWAGKLGEAYRLAVCRGEIAFWDIASDAEIRTEG